MFRLNLSGPGADVSLENWGVENAAVDEVRRIAAAGGSLPDVLARLAVGRDRVALHMYAGRVLMRAFDADIRTVRALVVTNFGPDLEPVVSLEEIDRQWTAFVREHLHRPD